MPCEHIKKLNSFVKKENMDISSMELLRVVCNRCRKKETCSSLPVEYFESGKD